MPGTLVPQASVVDMQKPMVHTAIVMIMIFVMISNTSAFPVWKIRRKKKIALSLAQPSAQVEVSKPAYSPYT